MDNHSVFISHATADDPFVKALRAALEIFGLKIWADSRELVPGDKLSSEIEQAIAKSEAFIVVASNHSIQSRWVIKEVRYAIKMRSERGAERFKIIPILLDGFSKDGLNNWFDEELIYVPASTAPGGLQESLPTILTALGLLVQRPHPSVDDHPRADARALPPG